MTRERKALGAAGEAEAARFLRRAGYRIVAKNYTCPAGEIDIVARQRDLIVFVEVRTRSTAQHAHPLDSVNHAKRRHVMAAAKHFLREARLSSSEYRFDVIAVVWGAGKRPETVEHHPGAFAESRR